MPGAGTVHAATHGGRSDTMTHRCDHCETAIVDESTMVKRDGKTYCCNNCAMAMMESKSAPTQAPISR